MGNLAKGITVALSGVKPLSAKIRALFRKAGTSNSHMYQAGEMVPVLGPELFDTANMQSLATGWSVSGGRLIATGVAVGGLATTVATAVSGKKYRVSYRINSISGGGVSANIGGAVSTGQSVIGSYSEEVIATGTAISITGRYSTVTADIDNFSVREILSYTSTLNGFTSGNYGNSSGSTVATIDQPVGLVLDAAGSVGSELSSTGTTALVGTSTPATYAPSTGDGVVYRGATVNDQGYVVFSGLTQNANYYVSFSSITGTIAVRPGNYVDLPTATFGSGTPGILVNTGAKTTISVTSSTNSSSASFKISSLREITGLHASNATTAQQPKLRRGIVNLLTYSKDLSNGAWAKSGSTYSYPKLTESAVAASHKASESVTCPVGAYTAAFEVSAAERTKAIVSLSDGATGDASWAFDLATGQLITYAVGAGSWTGISGSITQLSNGNYLCAVSATRGAGTVSTPTIFCFDGVSYSYTGNGTSGINVYGGALFTGTLTAQQILSYGGIPLTTTAAASSSLGPRYWEFDGTDDRLALSAVPFQMADDHCVVVAVQPSAVADQYVYGQRNSSATNPVANSIRLTSAGSILAYYRDDSGVANQSEIATAYASGERIVVSCKVSGGLISVRKNGGSWQSVSKTVGAATFNTTNLGASETTTISQYFKGSIYSVIPLKGTFTDAEIAQLEAQAAKSAGGRLVNGAFVSNYQ